MRFLTALVTLCLTACVCSANVDPIVTLSHGGQLQGVSTTFRNEPVNLFLGVQYAQAPVGELRFKKPQPVEGWKGIVDAKKFGNICPQFNFTDGLVVGNEDCLYMDITTPGAEIVPGAKKPVMVFIHGGAYLMGTGNTYAGAPLATTGDVIMVSINYRLGVLGFLSSGKGTGNYGLWDQRFALVWVKENIAQFGGDPDLVTIFGESAGAGSVSCQTIGQHNDGLFKRAITQSGTCFLGFGNSENVQHKIHAAMREQSKCDPSVAEVFECLKDLSAEAVTQLQYMHIGFMFPTPDDDFFSADTRISMKYDLSHRFDYMGGFNGLEGGLFYAMEYSAYVQGAYNKSVEEGADSDLIREFLVHKCLTQITPFSPNLCADLVMDTYKIEEVEDDKKRAIVLAEFLGEYTFNADTVTALEEHSSSEKSTYAYYYTEPSKVNGPLWTTPDWMKVAADHGEELSAIFGASFFRPVSETNSFWKDLLELDPIAKDYFLAIKFSDEDREISQLMMTMWTNFARSGNPNKPLALPSTTPTWQEFTSETKQFMELRKKTQKMIPTPNIERLHKIQRGLVEARTMQRKADRVPVDAETSTDQTSNHDEL